MDDSEKRSSATIISLSIALVGLLSVVAKGTFDHWDDLTRFFGGHSPLKGSFYYLYNFPDPEGQGRRTWTRQDSETWIETFPSGTKHTLRRISDETIDGDHGTVYQLVNEPQLQYFVPDKGSKLMWLRMRWGDEPWYFFAEMHVDAPNS